MLTFGQLKLANYSTYLLAHGKPASELNTIGAAAKKLFHSRSIIASVISVSSAGL